MCLYKIYLVQIIEIYTYLIILTVSDLFTGVLYEMSRVHGIIGYCMQWVVLYAVICAGAFVFIVALLE